MALFNDDQQQQIRQAIEEAEKHTSGEIRVCVEKHCSEEAIHRAIKYFHKLGMYHTVQRHGVLIYLATADRKFAIIGDRGIDKVVPADFWNSTRDTMLQHFKKGDLIAGLTTGLALAGKQLKKYFPQNEQDKINQLPDDIAFMDGE